MNPPEQEEEEGEGVVYVWVIKTRNHINATERALQPQYEQFVSIEVAMMVRLVRVLLSELLSLSGLQVQAPDGTGDPWPSEADAVECRQELFEIEAAILRQVGCDRAPFQFSRFQTPTCAPPPPSQ